MKDILLFIHQLPQNLVGLIVLLVNKKSVRKVYYCGVKYYLVKHAYNCGVSLGNYIFLDSDMYDDNFMWYRDTVLHEHGHQIQSKYLGWLYLPVVGLTSAIFNNLWERLFHKKWSSEKKYKWYYSRFPENWADKLGGVKRSLSV